MRASLLLNHWISSAIKRGSAVEYHRTWQDPSMEVYGAVASKWVHNDAETTRDQNKCKVDGLSNNIISVPYGYGER